MDNETIPTDVSDAGTAVDADDQAPGASLDTELEVDEAPPTDPVSKREAAMASLAENRKEEQAGERKSAALINEPELTPEAYDERIAAAQEESPSGEAPIGAEAEQPAGEGEGRAVSAEDDPPATLQNGWRTNDDGVRVKTLMVNGEPREITEEQFDRMAQKDLAGDQKLRAAAEADRVLGERKRLLDEQERRIAEQSQQPPEQGATEDLQAAIAEHSELLLEGDTDAANAKMADIIGMGRASSTPNIDMIAAQAATRAVAQVEQRQAQSAHDASINDGWEALKADYKDVVGDPDALAFADIQVKKIRDLNDGRTPKEIILEAAKITRVRLHLDGGEPAGDPAPGSDIPDLTAERTARKAKIRPLPKATVRQQAKPAAPEVDQSPAGKIKRMRATRAL